MTPAEICCVSCGSRQVRLVGDIPDSDSFAGTLLPEPLQGGSLYFCSTCQLSFRYPQLDKSQLDRLYRGGSGTQWQQGSIVRKDWQIAVSWIRERFKPGSAVLDVGCFDGGFLAELGNSYRRYGVEIHPEAGLKARARGVVLVGQDAASIQRSDLAYEVVVAFDVIEHMADPRIFLRTLAEVVKPGGAIIIATGNSQAASWKFMGARYWYCANAEHVAFINPAWCSLNAAACGLEVLRLERYRHGDWGSLGAGYAIQEISRNVAYRLAPRVCAWLRVLGFGKRRIGAFSQLAYQPPVWLTAKDHFIVHFQKL